MAHHKPPFTLETAQEKVKASQASWNSQYEYSVSLSLSSPPGPSGDNKPFPLVHKHSSTNLVPFFSIRRL